MPARLSVVITTFRNESFIETAIRSVLDQDFIDFHLFVLEDHGPDKTYDIACRFAGPRVTVVRNRHNLGQHRNKNAGLALAHGELVKFLDGDDYLLPGALARLVKEHDRHNNEASAVFARTLMVDSDGRCVGSSPIYGVTGLVPGGTLLSYVLETWGKGSCLGNVSPHLFRTAALRDVGGFPETNTYAGDWETFLKLMIHGKVAFTEEIVAAYRNQPMSISSTSSVLCQATDAFVSVHSTLQAMGLLSGTSLAESPGVVRRQLLESFLNRYIYSQRMRRLLGRDNCDRELRALFQQRGCEVDLDQLLIEGFPRYVFATAGTKLRMLVGAASQAPVLAGLRKRL